MLRGVDDIAGMYMNRLDSEAVYINIGVEKNFRNIIHHTF